ncbi:MAG: YecA family protein [Rubrivivax sp.]|nr:YecA family protein [Rubrivivax sp.]
MTVANTAGLSDTDLLRLETLLDGLPPPLQPMDVSALDGYLCGVLLQPRPLPAEQWLPRVSDMDGRPAPAGPALDELQALVRRRHAELDQAIAQRQWFDPWIYQLDDADGPSESVLPWVAGFAAAMDAFPALMAMSDTELVEPLALLFMHFDPDDLEDADALLEVIETLEPPADLAEAVQDIVRALMLMADVTRPRAPAPRPARTPRPARRPGGAGGGRRPR